MAFQSLKLRWQRTWNDVPRDFKAYDGERKVGRVHFSASALSPEVAWSWSGGAYIEHPGGAIWSGGNGRVGSKQAACEALEAE